MAFFDASLADETRSARKETADPETNFTPMSGVSRTSAFALQCAGAALRRSGDWSNTLR